MLLCWYVSSGNFTLYNYQFTAVRQYSSFHLLIWELFKWNTRNQRNYLTLIISLFSILRDPYALLIFSLFPNHQKLKTAGEIYKKTLLMFQKSSEKICTKYCSSLTSNHIDNCGNWHFLQTPLGRCLTGHIII